MAPATQRTWGPLYFPLSRDEEVLVVVLFLFFFALSPLLVYIAAVIDCGVLLLVVVILVLILMGENLLKMWAVVRHAHVVSFFFLLKKKDKAVRVCSVPPCTRLLRHASGQPLWQRQLVLFLFLYLFGFIFTTKKPTHISIFFIIIVITIFLVICHFTQTNLGLAATFVRNHLYKVDPPICPSISMNGCLVLGLLRSPFWLPTSNPLLRRAGWIRQRGCSTQSADNQL